ncbi:MAG: HAMP domain-containing sensor histidine kinase [Planctomycetota bacterium]|nr:HAMP domain-containing sensor histidine kinase [Planctomycetota bacterium]
MRLPTAAAAFLSEPRHVVASLRMLVFVGLAVLGWSEPPLEPFLFWSITVVYGVTVIGYMAARNGEFGLRRVRYMIFLFDVLVVCGLLLLRGRDVQALVMAYATLLLLAGLMAGIGSAFINGLIVSALFTVVTGWGVEPETLLTFEHLGPVLFFFVIAVFMGHVAGETRRRADEKQPAGGVPSLRRSTERLRAARAGVQAEDRLNTLGLVTAGVAHEMRRPLAILLSGANDGAQLLADLRAALAAGQDPAAVLEELDDVFDDAEDASQRLQRIAADLNQIGGRGSSERRAVPVRETLEGAERMLRKGAGDGVELEVRAETTRAVRCDPSRLLQTLLILGDNAFAALENADGGTVTMTAEDVGTDGVAFVVEDTGCGIPADTQERMYDPFFTTRAAGRGTGLGLYVLREIVHALGGRVDCESTVGHGSRFRIELPALDPAAESADAA